MSQWLDQVKNHQIWQVLNSLGPAIDEAINQKGIDSSAVESLARLRTVLSFTGKRLAGADAYLLQIGPLDNLASALQSATTEVQAFITDGNAGRINIANQHADVGLTQLLQIHVPFTTDDFIAAKEAAETYRRGLDNILASTQTTVAQTHTDIGSLRAQLSELIKDVATERARLSALASEHQSQFSSAQDSRSREWLDAQSSRQEKLAALMTEYTDRLTAKEAEFAQLKDGIAQQHATTLDEMRKQFVDSATLIRDEITERKKEVEKLVGVIGNLGVTSGYQKSANEARTTTRVWQVVAVASMLGLIAVAVYAFLPELNKDFTWPGFAGRVFISLTVGALAAYAGSQADKYQKIERRSRKFALEFEAIGPYIAPLPQDKQEEFRLKVGERSFGQDDSGLNINDKSPVAVIDILKSKEAREIIGDIAKTAK